MTTTTSIEWTDTTWNPTTGCTKVSPGCDNCYAERIVERFTGKGSFAVITRSEPKLFAPFTWRKPRRVFVNSMSDLFHDQVPDAFIVQVFSVMARTPRHTYQLLTKRHGRMRSLLSTDGFRDAVLALAPGALWPLRNLWLGVSVEDQQRATLRVPALLDTPAWIRWLSCEPLLGPIDLGAADQDATCDGGIDWVVVGGESGPGARPMHPGWARGLRDQCTDTGIPFFFKQWGEHLPVAVADDPQYAGGRAFEHPRGARISASIRERGPSGTFRAGVTRAMRPGDRNGHGLMLDRDTIAVRVGKKAAGRDLDGRTFDEFPAGPRGIAVPEAVTR